jgi:hypothetical protein
MPIADPEGEFGSFKTMLYEQIRKEGLINTILLKTDAYQEFGNNLSQFSSGAFWYFVSLKTTFKPNGIGLEFWEQFPNVKKVIMDNTQAQGSVLLYKYKYPQLPVSSYSSEVL